MDRGLTTIEDYLYAEQPVMLDNLLECAGQDRATWRIGDLPATTTLRYIILGMDWAAKEPKRWKTWRARYMFPDLSQEDLAVMLGISQQTVSNHLQPVRLAETDEFFNKSLMPEAPITIIDNGKLTMENYKAGEKTDE